MLCLVSEHYADDLEVDLEAFMLQDFNVELQDDSARQVRVYHIRYECSNVELILAWLQVSVTLVSLHQECLQGNFSRIQQLMQGVHLQSQNLANSQQQVVCSPFPLACGCKSRTCAIDMWNMLSQ